MVGSNTYEKEKIGHDVEADSPKYHHDNEHNLDVEDAHAPDADGVRPLHRKLKNRHMQMIAIGGAIGAGLFIGSGGALYRGGPASLLIDFIIIGIMMLMTVQALGELAVMYPVNGAFFHYSVRFIDPSWGFAMGWNYAMSWLVILPFELIAAGVTISFWTGNYDNDDVSITPAAWITIFLVLIIIINIFGVRGYGEVEFILGTIKVIAVIGFIILGIVINAGGVPTPERPGYIGGLYWRNPPADYPPFPADPNADPPTEETPRSWSAFRNGFKGWCSVFVTAAFAFAGTELVGLAAAEADNPRKSIPRATKQVFWRIAIFYVLSLLLLGLIVPSDDPTLKRASGANSKYSPMVRAMTLANIKVLPHIFNAVITLAVISVANSCTYGSTRTIQALALNGMAPKIFSRVDKHGRPYVALGLALIFGFLAYVNLAPKGGVAFDWLLALSALSNLFTWASICLAHILYRRAWKLAGRQLDELPFTAAFGVTGSWIGLFLNIIALMATFYVSLYPVGGPDLDVEIFFQNYLAGPVVIVFFIGHKIYTAVTGGGYKWGVSLANINVDEGRRELNLRDEMDAERAERAAMPFWKRTLKGMF